MRFRTMLSLATLFLTCFTLAVWSQPLSARPATRSAPAPENHSVSGRIASIGDASFSVEAVKENHTKQTLRFLVDDATKVEGRLAVGSQATVEYRSDGENNFAVHVVVKRSSGIHPK